MIKRAEILTKLFRKDKWKGKIIKILEGQELQDKCQLFAKISVEPGSEVPIHYHTADCETYYILSGTAEVNDNGTMQRMSAGDVIYTPNGQYHSIKNIGDTDLEFIALILLI